LKKKRIVFFYPVSKGKYKIFFECLPFDGWHFSPVSLDFFRRSFGVGRAGATSSEKMSIALYGD